MEFGEFTHTHTECKTVPQSHATHPARASTTGATMAEQTRLKITSGQPRRRCDHGLERAEYCAEMRVVILSTLGTSVHTRTSRIARSHF